MAKKRTKNHKKTLDNKIVLKDNKIPSKMNDDAVKVNDSDITKSGVTNSTMDAFTNLIARIGAGTSSQLEGTEYPLTRLSRNFQLMNSLYRSHWIVRRVIDVIPQDMCKNWFTITSQLEPDQIDKFNKKSKKIKKHILKGLKWGRLYGGAVGVMLIKGHGEKMEDPLELDDIYPDDFKGIKIYDRWSGVHPGVNMIDDISEEDFGLPEYYDIKTEDTSLRVHHSRVLRFIGRDLPYWEEIAEQRWGASELEHVYDELKKRDNTSWNIANLVFLANLRVLKMGDLGESLAVNNDRVQEDIYNTVQAQNWLMSNQGMYILGKDDDFQSHSYSFAGLSEVYENFMLDIAGAAEIPVTKLFGRSPAGMNATGESDMQNYYDMVQEKQESDLSPVLDKLMPVMCMSLFGAVPDDMDYKFNPIKNMTDEEKSTLAQSHVTTVGDAYDRSLISQKTAMKELRQMSEKTGIFTNITDEDIEAADDEIEAPIEELKSNEELEFDPVDKSVDSVDKG